MTSYPFTFRAAQIVGISGAAWLGGNIAGLSLNTMPALLRSHKEEQIPSTILVKQWRNIFENGKSQNSGLAAAVASTFVYLAWSVRSGTPLFKKAPYNRSGLYVAAALSTLGIVPYTIVAMTKTNTSLLEKAESTSAFSDTETASLLQRWIALNQMRSFLPLTAAVCGFLASFI